MNCSVTILCLQPELDLLIVSLTLIISLVLTGLSLAILLSHRRSVKPGNTRKRSGCHCQNVAVQIYAQKKKTHVELYFKHLGAFQVSCEEDLADYSNSRQQVSRPFYRLWWELSGKNKSTASL